MRHLVIDVMRVAQRKHMIHGLVEANQKRHGPPSEAVVVAVTNGHLDSGVWERIFSGQAEWLARESWRPAAKTGAGQDYWGVGALRAILSVVAYGSGGPQPRDGLDDKMAGVES